MTYPKVSIIIVNFNQKRLTLTCLTSLKKITYPNFEITLVDNGSTDNTTSEVKKRFPKVRVYECKENLGFTGGNNRGIERAKGKYILLLNNDTKVTPGFLEPLVEDLEKDSFLGIVQSKIFVMDKPTLLDSVVSYQTLTGFLFHKGYLDRDKKEYQKFMYTFSAKGVCMLVRKEVFKVGLLDDDYFAYFEETDLCWRAWVTGYKVGFEPRSVIYHKMGATSVKMKSAFINYHSFKNRIRTILKNSSSATLLWMLPVHLAACIALTFYFLVSGNAGASLSIIKALWWNILHLEKTLKLRNKVQVARKLSDAEIFNLVMRNPSLGFYTRHLSLVKEYLSRDRKA